MCIHLYMLSHMKNNTQLTATTVKIDKSLYGDFKILGIRSGMTLQDFVEKCVYLYVKDPNFQTIIRTVYPACAKAGLASGTGSFFISPFTGSL